MENAGDKWFTLDVAGDATFANDASAKQHKSPQDLERLVFGDNFSSRVKASKSNVASAKLQSKGRVQRPVSSQKKTTTRRAAGASSDDGDSSSIGDNVRASSDEEARSDDAANIAGDSSRVRAAAWQDEDDDAVQVSACPSVSSSRVTLAIRWTCRPSHARRSCG
jgi:hypothetical protein